MLLVNRWATPTVVALETLDREVAQPGYSSCLALEMRRDLNSAVTLAGGTVYALIYPGLGVRCVGECTVCEVYTCWIDISLL